MYTYEKSAPSDDTDNWYDILDPEGTIICCVVGETQAISLLTHLNR